MFGWIRKLFKPEPAECNHIYFPVKGWSGDFIGQECSLCGKFNSLAQLGFDKKERYE